MSLFHWALQWASKECCIPLCIKILGFIVLFLVLCVTVFWEIGGKLRRFVEGNACFVFFACLSVVFFSLCVLQMCGWRIGQLPLVWLFLLSVKIFICLEALVLGTAYGFLCRELSCLTRYWQVLVCKMSRIAWFNLQDIFSMNCPIHCLNEQFYYIFMSFICKNCHFSQMNYVHPSILTFFLVSLPRIMHINFLSHKKSGAVMQIYYGRVKKTDKVPRT